MQRSQALGPSVCGPSTRIKASNFIVATILVNVFMISTAIAQNAANQVSNVEMVTLGTTKLDPSTISSRIHDNVRNQPDNAVDLSVARLLSARGAGAPGSLAFPSPTADDIADNPGVSGFLGLTHLDQWSAGTGIYKDSQSPAEPPDQGLAVGNGFVLEAVNSALAVYDQHGKRLNGPTPLNQFFRLRPENISATLFGDFVTDPKCYFDQQTQRWFVTVVKIDIDPVFGNFINQSHLLIAVSKSADPTEEFKLFRIDSTDNGSNGTQNHTGCPCYGDQPLIGADTNGFYISTNEFSMDGTVFNGSQIYAMSKKLLADGKLSTVVHFGDLPLKEGIAYSVQPATSANLQEDSDGSPSDGGDGVEYFLSALDFLRQLDHRIAVWAMTNTASLSESHPQVKMTKVVITSEVYGRPPNADQKSGPTPLRAPGDAFEQLATNDDRMNQVVLVNGKLWSGVNTVVQQRGGFRAGIAFFLIAPAWHNGVLAAQIDKQGYLSVRGNDVMFPSISVDGRGNAILVFTLAGPDYFPSVAFARINDEESERNIHIIARGAAPEDGYSGYASQGFPGGVARWGDYSAAVTDEEGNVWIAAEFIPGGKRSPDANWGTFIAKAPLNEP